MNGKQPKLCRVIVIHGIESRQLAMLPERAAMMAAAGYQSLSYLGALERALVAERDEKKRESMMELLSALRNGEVAVLWASTQF